MNKKEKTPIENILSLAWNETVSRSDKELLDGYIELTNGLNNHFDESKVYHQLAVDYRKVLYGKIKNE